MDLETIPIFRIIIWHYIVETMNGLLRQWPQARNQAANHRTEPGHFLAMFVSNQNYAVILADVHGFFHGFAMGFPWICWFQLHMSLEIAGTSSAKNRFWMSCFGKMEQLDQRQGIPWTSRSLDLSKRSFPEMSNWMLDIKNLDVDMFQASWISWVVFDDHFWQLSVTWSFWMLFFQGPWSWTEDDMCVDANGGLGLPNRRFQNCLRRRYIY